MNRESKYGIKIPIKSKYSTSKVRNLTSKLDRNRKINLSNQENFS